MADNWIDNLKVGDEVIRRNEDHNPAELKSTYVARVLPASIVTNDGEYFRKKTGRLANPYWGKFVCITQAERVVGVLDMPENKQQRNSGLVMVELSERDLAKMGELHKAGVPVREIVRCAEKRALNKAELRNFDESPSIFDKLWE